MTVSRFFITDVHGDTVDPDKWYSVVLYPRVGERTPVTEFVSGEDLLTCAEFLDSMLQKEDSNDD